MRSIRYTTLAAGFVLILLASVLAGCGTSTAYRYYTLAPVASGTDGNGMVADTDSVVLGVGPLTIPDYLDRPQIVIRTTGNALKFSEHARWAGSLAADASRVLEERLDAMLSDKGVAVVSWQRGVPNDYRVAVQVTRFDITEGKGVVLKAQWLIYARNGKQVLLLRESDIRVPLKDSGTDAAVESMGRALSLMSREIVQGFDLVMVAGAEKVREEIGIVIEEARPER